MNIQKKSLWSNELDGDLVNQLLETLKLVDENWLLVQNAHEASLWALQSFAEEDLQSIATLWQEATEKPKILLLAPKFIATNLPQTVFFKTPIDRSVLENWLKTQGFLNQNTSIQTTDTSAESTDTADTSTESTDSSTDQEISAHVNLTLDIAPQRWLNEPFRLSAWPNLNNYAGGVNLLLLCRSLILKQHRYEELVKFDIDNKLLNEFLMDADNQGLLDYSSSDASATNDVNRDMLFFKLANKFNRTEE